MGEQIYQIEINFSEFRTFESLNRLKNQLIENMQKMSLITVNLGAIETLIGAEWQFILMLNKHCNTHGLILQINPIEQNLYQEAKLYGFHNHLSLETK